MSRLKIAVQSSGRLHDDSLKLLKDCGISINNGKDQLKVVVNNFPVEILYLRNSDIPQYLEDGVADVAIIGDNLLVEKQKQIDVIEPLGFAKCRVSLALPKSVKGDDLGWFEGKKIATSYPNTLQAFLDEKGIKADLHVISGSVEIAPNIGLADAICDIVSSGSTLFRNGLRESFQILSSEAVLARSRTLDRSKEEILDRLLFRIRAVQGAKKRKYILLNVPDAKIEAVSSILPVLKSPTILPLAEKGWSSLHSVIEESMFWEVIDELKAAGAEGILVIPIDKIVM